jgi:hypothetical protein
MVFHGLRNGESSNRLRRYFGFKGLL